jgi:hypothetical protein
VSEALTGTRSNCDAAGAESTTTTRHAHRRSIDEPLPITEHQIRGAIHAAHHLIGHDLPPIFNLETLRALWCTDHELGLRLAEIAGVL